MMTDIILLFVVLAVVLACWIYCDWMEIKLAEKRSEILYGIKQDD